EVAKGEDGLVLLPLHPVTELRVDNKLVGHTSDLPGFAGTLITERTEEPNFYCPDCGARIEVMSKDKQQDGDDEGEMMPVTSRTYFTKKQRTCIVCKAPLWQRRRSDASRRRWAMPTFADWSAAIAQIQEDGELAQFGADSQRRRIARVERDADGDGLMITLGREAPSDFSPYEYALLKYEGLAAIHLADEAHNARGTNTDIARSIHYGFKQAQTYAILSGTISGGMLGGLYHLIYRFWPQFWKRLGLGWNDVEVAMLRYGFVTETVTEHEGDSRRGSGQTDRSISSVPAPGMSAKLIPMLLERIIFIDAEKDLGAFMPDMEEIPDVVDMDDPAIATARRGAKEEVTVAYDQLRAAQQAYAALMNDPGASSHERATAEAEVTEAKEAHRAAEANQKEVDQRADAVDLAAAYDRIASRLDELAEDRIQAAILAKGMLPRWWSTLPCVNPAFTVTRTTRGTWGDLLSEERIFTAPVLAADYRYPLEKRLIEHVTAQLAQGRTVMVYIEQNAVRSTPTRLAEVLAAFAPWTLPNNVDPEDREDAIRAAYEQGKKVFIVPYRRVSEGLNLQFLDTVIWYEMAQNYYHLEQSNLRIRRLGATNLKQVIYLVYRGTVSHKKLIKLGEQSGSASLFAGDTPEGALVQTAGADKTTLAQMSASVEQVDAVELSDDDLKAVFARRSQAANAARKQGRTWAGITDTLPQRLDALRAAWATKAAATLPTIVISAHTPAPVAAHTPAPVAAHTPALVAAPTPKLAFGDLDFIGAVLRKKRRTTRKQGQFEAQFDMFSAAASNHPTPAPGGTAGQLSMF
ncbi:hypothetical protein K2Z83_28130, partial [Oscillochloris sp. ZM17-4]|nr:hypothetical protein [Oscillochloris sp. ZM17-4]